MNKNLFRQKNLDQLSSPEKFNDYIKVCTPPLWILLVAIALILLGAIIWGALGHLETVLNTVAVCQDNKCTVYVKDKDVASVINKRITIDETEELTIREQMVDNEPFALNQELNEYAKYLGKFQQGEWVYKVHLDIQKEDGIYPVAIITDDVSPMSFIIN